MSRLFVALGALSALVAVAAGAFGAHALRSRLAPEMLAAFETGVRYQMYHALALLAIGLAGARWPQPALAAAGFAFVAGTVLFSGSLYGLAAGGIRWLGPVTPIGGVLLMLGWLCVLWAALAAR